MKNLLSGFLLTRDKNTETLRPMVLRVLARCVYFPDGKTLLEKWNEYVSSGITVIHKTEVAQLETNSYKWSCLTYGTEKYQLSGHYKPNIENAYKTITNPAAESGFGSIAITKTNSDGSTTQEEIPFGTTGEIHQYQFLIPLPIDFTGDNSFDYQDANVIVSEGPESSFLKNHMFHNISVEQKDGTLLICVNHYKGLDGVDITSLPYVSGDFNIYVDGLFLDT
jgi:hypothetical protein